MRGGAMEGIGLPDRGRLGRGREIICRFRCRDPGLSRVFAIRSGVFRVAQLPSAPARRLLMFGVLPTLHCRHKSHDLQSHPRRISNSLLFVIRPLEWRPPTARPPPPPPLGAARLCHSDGPPLLQRRKRNVWKRRGDHAIRAGGARRYYAVLLSRESLHHTGETAVILQPTSFESWTIGLRRL